MFLSKQDHAKLVTRNIYTRQNQGLWGLVILPILLILIIILRIHQIRAKKRGQVATTQVPMPEQPTTYYKHEDLSGNPYMGYMREDLPPQPSPVYVPPSFDETDYGYNQEQSHNRRPPPPEYQA